MTVARMVGLLVCFALIGIAAVSMRGEQARHHRRIEQLQLRRIELRRELWSQEMELARLRSPQMIRERAARLGVTEGEIEEGPATLSSAR